MMIRVVKLATMIKVNFMLNYLMVEINALNGSLIKITLKGIKPDEVGHNSVAFVIAPDFHFRNNTIVGLEWFRRV